MKEFRGLELTIDGGNAAFGGSPEDAMAEVTRIVREAVLPFLSTSHPEGLGLRDINGNTVGRIEVVYNREVK